MKSVLFPLGFYLFFVSCVLRLSFFLIPFFQVCFSRFLFVFVFRFLCHIFFAFSFFVFCFSKLSVLFRACSVVVCFFRDRFSKRGIDTGRMVVALAESTVFRKLAKPITIPAKLWLTWKFVQVVNGDDATDADADADADGAVGNRGSGGGNSAERGEGRGKGKGTVLRSSGGGGGVRKDRGRKTTVVTDRERESPWGSSPEGRRAGGGGGGWGWGRRTGRKRAAICPPGEGGGPGCFVPPLPVGGVVTGWFVPPLTGKNSRVFKPAHVW